MVKNYVLHPFLIAIYPILFLFSRNLDQISLKSILFPGILSLLLVSSSYAIFKYFTSNRIKTGLIISLITFIFFSYGHIFIGLQKLGLTISVVRHRYLVTFFIIVIVTCIYLIRKTQGSLLAPNYILNILGIILVSFSLAQISFYKLSEKNGKEVAATYKTSGTETTDLEKYPDIYYIILDGYASQSTLKKVYNYDNGEFIDTLKEQRLLRSL